jgi:hypothetical protein
MVRETHFGPCKKNENLSKSMPNAWTVKIGEGSGPRSRTPGSATGNRGPLPKSDFWMVTIGVKLESYLL